VASLEGLLEERGILVADGGMGTLLMSMGMTPEAPPELWNADAPDRIRGIHDAYVEAGADILLTNTFGGTTMRLGHKGLADRAAELNRAGVELAREAAEAAGHPVLVAGSMGPAGALMEPLGSLGAARAEELFTAQAAVLAEAGVDILWMETMSALEEMSAAVAAASGRGVPVVATMSFDTNGRTMMGVPPADLGAWWVAHDLQPAAIGANCGIGPKETVAAVGAMAETAPGTLLIAKGNCGRPVLDCDSNVTYPVGPAGMGDYAREAVAAGARIIGACCGSTPAHIAEIRRAVDEARGA
jgi:5-methyltetrahydrofolate--homocysteine methyltransferase